MQKYKKRHQKTQLFLDHHMGGNENGERPSHFIEWNPAILSNFHHPAGRCWKFTAFQGYRPPWRTLEWTSIGPLTPPMHPGSFMAFAAIGRVHAPWRSGAKLFIRRGSAGRVGGEEVWGVEVVAFGQKMGWWWWWWWWWWCSHLHPGNFEMDSLMANHNPLWKLWVLSPCPSSRVASTANKSRVHLHLRFARYL